MVFPIKRFISRLLIHRATLRILYKLSRDFQLSGKYIKKTPSQFYYTKLYGDYICSLVYIFIQYDEERKNLYQFSTS